MSPESIKTKIAALLAKAEGTDNQFEAAAFMAKVNELLERHQIEIHEIRAASGDKDPIGKEQGATNIYASMGWARDVAGALARYYGCEFVYRRMGNHFSYDVIGRESARMTFEMMLPFIISQIRVQAKPIAARVGKSIAEREVGQALVIRIYKLIPQAQAHRDELAKNALVPVTDIKAAMEELYPNLKKARATQYKYGQAAKDAADKVSLNVQATGKHTKLIK